MNILKIKLILLGEKNVGKTTIIAQYTNKKIPEEYIYDIQQVDIKDDPEPKKLKIQINPKKFEIPNNSLLTYLIICQGNNELMKAPKPELPITGKKNKITNPIYFDISKFPPGDYKIMFLIKSQNVNGQDYDYFGNIYNMKKDFTILE